MEKKTIRYTKWSPSRVMEDALKEKQWKSAIMKKFISYKEFMVNIHN